MEIDDNTTNISITTTNTAAAKNSTNTNNFNFNIPLKGQKVLRRIIFVKRRCSRVSVTLTNWA